MALNFTLGDIAQKGSDVIDPMESDLRDGVEQLGPNTTAGELLAFQAKLTMNSVATATFSAVLKERSDTLKGVVQKF